VTHRRHLLAPQPVRPAARAPGEPDVLGLQRDPSAAEELGQSGTVDHGVTSTIMPTILAADVRLSHVLSIHPSALVPDG
jgi:hypothetical protein